MKLLINLFAIAGIGLVSIFGTTTVYAAEPTLSDLKDFRSTGTVQLVNSEHRTVVIDDREYLVSDSSVKKLVRGARVNFSYRESKPMPIISDISVQR